MTKELYILYGGSYSDRRIIAINEDKQQEIDSLILEVIYLKTKGEKQ